MQDARRPGQAVIVSGASQPGGLSAQPRLMRVEFPRVEVNDRRLFPLVEALDTPTQPGIGP